MDVREARMALGWSRATLADRARVDRRVVQLIELGLSEDEDSIRACEVALVAATEGGPRGPSDDGPVQST